MLGSAALANNTMLDPWRRTHRRGGWDSYFLNRSIRHELFIYAHHETIKVEYFIALPVPTD